MPESLLETRLAPEPMPPVHRAGPPQAVDETSGGRPQHRNSFDAIRMGAAFCVFYSHELGMAGYVEPPLGPLGITLSSTGLYIFFGLSGYLVFKSLDRDPRVARYLAARALRIFPAWIVCILACAALGACVTSLSGHAFWTDPQTRAFLLHDLPIVTTPTQFYLPGVFASARWSAVNGSIWTVKYELLCYLALLVPYTLIPPSLMSRRTWLAVAGLALLVAYVHHITTTPNPVPEVFFSRYNAFNVLRFFMTFAAGALYAASEPLSERARLAALLIPGGLITFGPSPEIARAGIILLLTLIVIELGKSRLLFSRTYRRIGDLSYGTFLYAYPIQNLITTELFDGTNFALVVALSTAAILCCAFLSWRLIERPALRLKW